MKQNLFVAFVATCAALFLSEPTIAVQFLNPGDFIIGIDTDVPVSNSGYPGDINHTGNQGPMFAIDSNETTKYLNFAKLQTGLIVTPLIGSTTVQSLQLTTANDAEARDPLSWKLFGTNDPVTSADNSTGTAENWTLISENNALLPSARGALGPAQGFANSTAYSSYRVVFPTVKNPGAANSMQIADVNLFTTNNASGSPIWTAGFDPIIAIQLTNAVSPINQTAVNLLDGDGSVPSLPSLSSYPGTEGPDKVLDGTVTKYLNNGGPDSGFIVTPAFGSSKVQSFQLTTANDFELRDPSSWELYGTNNSIMSLDNSFGTGESWTLIDSGALSLPGARNTLTSAVSVTNGNNYSSYKMLFPTLKGGANQVMQIGEVSFFESTTGAGPDILNTGDSVLAIDATERLGTETKYVNFGKENSGFIVTPAAGSKVIKGFQLTTANDFPERDPTSYELYGTNDSITSKEFGQGDEENWVLIDSGAIDLPTDRFTPSDVFAVSNTAGYTSYRLIFPSLRDANLPNADSMQISGVKFFDSIVTENADFDGDGDVDGRDFLVWQRGFGLTGQSNNTNGDADGSGTVDGGDLAVWQNQFGSGSLTASVAVPEPISAVSMMLGLVLLVWKRQR